MAEQREMWRPLPERLRPRSGRRKAPSRLHALRNPRADGHTRRLFTPSMVISVVHEPLAADRDDRRLAWPVIRLIT